MLPRVREGVVINPGKVKQIRNQQDLCLWCGGIVDKHVDLYYCSHRCSRMEREDD